MRLLLVSLLLISYTSIFGCINGPSKFLKNGDYVYMSEINTIPEGHHFNTENIANSIHELDSLYKTKKDLDYLADIGYLKIIGGDYKGAINIYKKVEKEKPNQYSTASNIGTAYELIGDNKNALKWITKAIELDSTSHFGSEWIHVNILKQKIGLTKLSSIALLETDFGIERKPSTRLKAEEIEQLRKALYFQLAERMSFIKEENEILALLLFDYGNLLTFQTSTRAEAEDAYKLAKEYGLKSPLLKDRIAYIKSDFTVNVINKTQTHLKENNDKIVQYVVYLAALILTSIILIVFFIRRRMKSK